MLPDFAIKISTAIMPRTGMISDNLISNGGNWLVRICEDAGINFIAEVTPKRKDVCMTAMIRKKSESKFGFSLKQPSRQKPATMR